MPMSIVLRLFVSVVLLAPSLVLAATLETPGNGDNLSGIGVIRGWKCEAVGDITVVIDGGPPISMAYGNELPGTQSACGDSPNGFVSIWNYGELDSGEHTAVAYDNGVEFARSTFTVVRASEEESFLRDVTAECTVPDFPDPGTNASFEWNQGTQHLELAEVGEDVVVPVSTKFDGEWDFVMELTEDINENPDGVCPCYSEGIRGTVSVVNGEIAIQWEECSLPERVITLSALISPAGQLESSFWIQPEADVFLTLGSLDGFLSDDGTGGGSWIHIYGCTGSWSVQRREDS